MKKLFVLGIMLLATVTLVSAQQQRQRMTAEETAKAQTARMEKLLSLKADQKAKIQAIDLDLAKQWDAKRQSTQGNREAMTKARQDIEKVRETKYKEVLTADQFKKFTEERDKMLKERTQGQPGQRGQGQGQRQRTN